MDISRGVEFLRVPFFMAYVNKTLKMIGASVNIYSYYTVVNRGNPRGTSKKYLLDVRIKILEKLFYA